MSFFLLAPYLAASPSGDLATGNGADASTLGVVVTGLGGTTVFGWSWIDPVIGLMLAGWAVYEGIEAWHGADCC